MTENIGEKCGIFGIFDKKIEASRVVYHGLWALQHRGQESSGIASSDGEKLHIYKDTGLVAHVYNEKILKKLKGHIAIGHNRYSTSKGSSNIHSQPVVINGKTFALAHNGNLPSTKKLEKFLTRHGITCEGFNDSELMYLAISYYLVKGHTIETVLKLSYPLFTGVFCLLVMTKNKLVALRDNYGIRPFSIGKYNGGYVFSSETCALDTVKAEYIGDVAPGEMAVVDDKGIHRTTLARGLQKLDIFEFVYFARPDSVILGKRVNEVRRNLGRNLAKEVNVKADVVIPVPDSAIPAALGFSEVSGIPFDHGLIKNRYIHRTFIRPTQKLRESDVSLKLNPIKDILIGKDVVIIDDSIVRGTTSRQLVQLVKNAGANKVHLLISSPPVKYPDFYGINTPNQKELIASFMSISEITAYIGADSLHFLSYEGMIASTGLSEEMFSTSCFSGIYPIDILERKLEINFRKHKYSKNNLFTQLAKQDTITDFSNSQSGTIYINGSH